MRLRIDPGLCQGHARCAALAPDLFDVDDEGYGLIIPGRDQVAADDERALLAIDNCPEQAIRLDTE